VRVVPAASAIALAALVGLAACSTGGSGSAGGGSTTPAHGATTSPARTVASVTVATTSPPTTVAPTTPPPATAAPTTASPATPAPAPAAPAVQPGRVLLVGDSVMAALNPEYTDAARKVLGAAGWRVVIDAAVNRSTSQGGPVLASMRPTADDTIVIMLGHNDAGSPKVFTPRVDTLLGQLQAVRRVFWLTMREPRYATANQVLAAEQAAHPNLRLIPWAASIQPGWTAKDGLHLNGSGATGMARLILQAIG
jgi:lysophospholipase L1-like esterase